MVQMGSNTLFLDLFLNLLMQKTKDFTPLELSFKYHKNIAQVYSSVVPQQPARTVISPPSQSVSKMSQPSDSGPTLQPSEELPSSLPGGAGRSAQTLLLIIGLTFLEARRIHQQHRRHQRSWNEPRVGEQLRRRRYRCPRWDFKCVFCEITL